MTGKSAFQIWAPAGARWIDWVRPVPFAAMNGSPPSNVAATYTVPNIVYIAKPQDTVAMIIDMPGYDGVKEGIALARMGFRPIPLFNGTNEQEGAMALVDNHPIESALRWGALELVKTTIAKNAPPAFLLDSNRTHRYKMNASVFDNSWDIYNQDMPSAEYFLSNGIHRLIVRGEFIQKDLNRILYNFQRKGIAIHFTDGYHAPKEVTVKRPPCKRN